MKTTIRIKTFVLCLLLFEGNVKAKSLTDILAQYCVPKSAGNCTGISRATYKEAGNFCACNTVLKYYKSADRVCEDCITGSFASSNYKTCEPINCPSGYKAVLITNGACPSGYALKQVTSGKCPSSNALKTWTYSTKTWK